MDERVVQNLKSGSRWFRLLFMVVFSAAAYISALLVLLIAIIQTIYGFISSRPNERLLAFSHTLNQFIFQITEFLSYNSDVKPYPFSDWPSSDHDSSNE